MSNFVMVVDDQVIFSPVLRKANNLPDTIPLREHYTPYGFFAFLHSASPNIIDQFGDNPGMKSIPVDLGVNYGLRITATGRMYVVGLGDDGVLVHRRILYGKGGKFCRAYDMKLETALTAAMYLRSTPQEMLDLLGNAYRVETSSYLIEDISNIVAKLREYYPPEEVPVPVEEKEVKQKTKK